MHPEARTFATQLEARAGLPVSLVDERLSSREAAAQAADSHGSHQGSTHELAAVIIAQGYLNNG